MMFCGQPGVLMQCAQQEACDHMVAVGYLLQLICCFARCSQERPRDDWKKLIVFSKQWKEHHKGVFDRVRELAAKQDNVAKKMMYRRMLRTLQGVRTAACNAHIGSGSGIGCVHVV